MNKAELSQRIVSTFESLNYVFSGADEIHTSAKWKSEITNIKQLCDLVGVKKGISVPMALFVYADDLSSESIIGRSRLISERLSPFKDFCANQGWTKLPVRADTFFVYENSSKAFLFRNSVQEYCKHYGISLSPKWVLPWGIDVSARSVWAYKGLPFSRLDAAKIERALFL